MIGDGRAGARIGRVTAVEGGMAASWLLGKGWVA